MADKKSSRKAPAKKATAKKAPAKKTSAKKAPVKKATAKKAPAKKPSTRKAPAKKAPAKRKTAARKSKKAVYTPEQVYSMIEQAAYFAAENDGFSKEPAEYWAQAEATINGMLKG